MLNNWIVPLSERRINRFATGSLFFLSGLCGSSWASRIPTIQQNLKLSDSAMGGVLMAAPIGLVLSLPVSGRLIEKRGSRTVVAYAGVTYAFVLLLLGLAPTALLLIFSLFLFGFSGNILNIAMNTQAVEVEIIYGRTIMASFHGLWSLASFAGALVGTGMMGGAVSPLGHFLLISLLAVGIVGLSYPNLVRSAPAAEEAKEAEEVREEVRRPFLVRPDRSLVFLGVLALFVMICEGAMADWSGIYFKKIIKVDASFVGLGYAAFTCTMAFGRFVADAVVTRIGLKKVLQGSGILISVGLFLTISFPHLSTAVIGLFLVGAGTSSVVPLVFSTAGKSKTVSPGTALASISTISFMGLLFGPPLIGFISGVSSLRIAFLFVSLLGLMISVMATRMKSARP
jgi:MFS family permease